ncbi:MAG: lipoate--protein ligase family protein [Microcoleaceae cyanobacterium]
MAIDEWLLNQNRLGQSPPVLRFYTWEPPAISLGYHQRQWPEFWQNLTWRGQPVQLLRRPTGGRAVLHQGDLTYAVVTAALPGRRLETYRAICEFLIHGWQVLGLNLSYGSAGRDYANRVNCFGLATGADLILDNGYKLIGSAQLRRDQAVLQHGSMRLEPDAELYRQVFQTEFSPDPHGILAQIKLPSHPELEGIAAIIQALTDAACECFQAKLTVQPLSLAELEQVRLYCEKFEIN